MKSTPKVSTLITYLVLAILAGIVIYIMFRPARVEVENPSPLSPTPVLQDNSVPFYPDNDRKGG